MTDSNGSAEMTTENTTIRALPGLIRAGTPLVVNLEEWASLGEPMELEDGSRLTLAASACADSIEEVDELEAEVNVSDPTGFMHLLWWVCGRVGLDASSGAMLIQDPDAWSVWTEGKGASSCEWFTIKPSRDGPMTGSPHVPTLDGITDPAKALVAIALHLDAAGGEG